MIDIDRVDFAKGNGLVPAIVQHDQIGQVLMLGYMNKEALENTLKEGRVTFYSRSKNRLWVKGETSGNTLSLHSVQIDCDKDTLLVKARPNGPVCHTGSATCFEGDHADPLSFLKQLEGVIDERKSADPNDSYVAHLTSKGLKKIAQKVGEEGVETALAAVSEDEAALKNEAADLLFHLLVLLRSKGLSLSDVVTTLHARHHE